MSTTLLLIIDSELPDSYGLTGNESFYQTSLFLNNGVELIPLNIRTLAKYCRLSDMTVPAFARKSPDKKKEVVNEIEKQIGVDMTKEILSANSKLTLNIILNSPGGHNIALKSILHITNFIKQNGGTINSYSFILVASAAAYIFSHTDNRYCLKLSEFMCHASVIHPDLEPMFNDDTDEEREISRHLKYDEYEEHLQTFFNRHNPASKERIEEIIGKSLEKKECSLYLGGYNLEKWGIVSRAYHDFEELLDLMERSIGEFAMKSERVSQFVKNMGDEYKLVLDDNSKYTQSLPALKCPE